MCVLVYLNAEVRSLAPAASHMERTPQNRRRPLRAAFWATVFHGYAVQLIHTSIAVLSVSRLEGRAVSSVVLSACNCKSSQYVGCVFFSFLEYGHCRIVSSAAP